MNLCTGRETAFLVTVSRGVRIPESRYERVYEVWRDMRKDHSIQVNEVINVLLEVGLTTFAHLPAQMRHVLFSRRSAREDLKLRVGLESRVTEIASTFRADDKLALRIPHTVKAAIRHEAQRKDMSMSAIARKRIILQEAAKEAA